MTIDDSFHLTPLDVRRFQFERVLRGYDPASVDRFREQVAGELERLTRLNQDLDGKVRNFTEQLKAFRERDKALNDALVSAQQLRSEIREQSERESQLILREARQQADHIIDAARTEIRALQEEIGNLDRMRRGYLTQLRMFVERQLSEISAALEGTPRAPRAQGAPPAGPSSVPIVPPPAPPPAPRTQSPQQGRGSSEPPSGGSSGPAGPRAFTGSVDKE